MHAVEHGGKVVFVVTHLPPLALPEAALSTEFHTAPISSAAPFASFASRASGPVFPAVRADA